MAKRVVQYVVLIDDLDGNEIPKGEGQTIRFGWKGTEYEIDLSDKHASELDTMMGNLVSKSVKVGRMLPHRPSAPNKRPAVEKPKDGTETPALPSSEKSIKQQMLADRAFRNEIRIWARENGFPGISATGRLSVEAREAWNAAHPDRQAPAETQWHANGHPIPGVPR